MGTIAIQTQCCHHSTKDDECYDTDSDDDDDSYHRSSSGGGQQKETAVVRLVDSVPWHGRVGGTSAGPPACPRPATMSRSLSETTTIVPQQQTRQQLRVELRVVHKPDEAVGA